MDTVQHLWNILTYLFTTYLIKQFSLPFLSNLIPGTVQNLLSVFQCGPHPLVPSSERSPPTRRAPSSPSTTTRQGWKKPGFKKRPSPVGFFKGFLGVFLNTFSQKREFLVFFSFKKTFRCFKL